VFAQATPALDVVYVPTPQPVVEAMLELAGVTRADVVYDLGSGDGRIVITAAKMYGARGVGFDLDPGLIRRATENAAAEGVSDRVRFVTQNLFDADIREASVVTLYLLQSLNERLRPKLVRELKPGTSSRMSSTWVPSGCHSRRAWWGRAAFLSGRLNDHESTSRRPNRDSHREPRFDGGCGARAER
jgi:ribosomal protein L11 methylase PrmA